MGAVKKMFKLIRGKKLQEEVYILFHMTKVVKDT